MSFLPTSRTRRNLFKVASLGLAGLLAGLLAGCNSADASIRTSRPQTATDSLSPDGSQATVHAGAATLTITQTDATADAQSIRAY